MLRVLNECLSCFLSFVSRCPEQHQICVQPDDALFRFLDSLNADWSACVRVSINQSWRRLLTYESQAMTYANGPLSCLLSEELQGASSFLCSYDKAVSTSLKGARQVCSGLKESSPISMKGSVHVRVHKRALHCRVLVWGFEHMLMLI